jgi:hypothetical protein
VLVGVLWWLSGTTWVAHLGPGDWQISSGGGLIGISHWPGRTATTESITGVPMPKGLQTVSIQRQYSWWFRAEWKPDQRSFAIPLWFPFLFVTILTIAAWRHEFAARRRTLIGCCSKCKYDRRGLSPTTPCPECGHTTQIA